MNLHRIVIGIDFSEPSTQAARWVATHLAPDAEVVLVHAVDIPAPPGPLRHLATPPDTLEETAREGADQRLRAVSRSAGLHRSWIEVRRGDAADLLAAVAVEYRADLIVLAAHGDRHGVPPLLGSVAERVIGQSAVPVLLMRAAASGRPRHVLAAVDGSELSPMVSAWSHELASRFGAEETLLTVSPAAAPPALVAAATHAVNHPSAEGRGEWIRQALGVLGADETPREVAVGDAAHEILAAASRHESGVIVIGRRGVGQARRALFGGVARSVLRDARCPVLVVAEPLLA